MSRLYTLTSPPHPLHVYAFAHLPPHMCMHVHLLTCACMCTSSHVHACAPPHMCMHVCLLTCACMCTSSHVHACVPPHMCMHVCLLTCACMCAPASSHVHACAHLYCLLSRQVTEGLGQVLLDPLGELASLIMSSISLLVKTHLTTKTPAS